MICRLCLQKIIVHSNCQPIEKSLLKFLKLNINICKANMMCAECANCLRVFSNITPNCFYMGDGTLPLSDLDNSVKLEPEATETKTNLKLFTETEMKCSFCTQSHGREDLISLKESKENKFLLNMLERYILETNLKNNEALLTCETCLEALQGGLTVILKCSEVEEKINKYIELEGTDDKGQVELKDVQQFMFGPIIKSEIEFVSVDKLEVQEEYTTMAEAEIKFEKEMSNTELVIKTEDNDITSAQSDCVVAVMKSEQSDCGRFQDFRIQNKNPSNIKMFKCKFCSYKAKRRGHLKEHLLIHKSPSELKMFKCEICSYEAKRKSNLKSHLLTHKSHSEIKIFKCEFCSYEAKQKRLLKGHLLTHKSPSEIKIYKCELCSYEGKHKCNLKEHLLIHKSPLEIETFKCEICSYEAKRKSNLKSHLLTHKSPSEIKIFKCEFCSYEAKQKRYLTIHLLTHKNPSAIKMFKCELCSYATKFKSNLKTHVLAHKSPSEITMFKCELCSFEAKRKSHLNTHLLTHKIPSETKVFKCELCSHETKQKSNLKRHLLTHKSPSEIKMFKCELCSYVTKFKSNLKPHVLTHNKSLLDQDV